MTKPGMVRVQCGKHDCQHHHESFAWVYYASYNEAVEGRPMPEDARRDLKWAICPECGTANLIDGPETLVWSW